MAARHRRPEGGWFVTWSQPISHLRVDVQHGGEGRVTIRFAGDFDLLSRRLAQRAAEQVLEDAKELVLDFSRVTFFDVSGIRFLLTVQRQADGAGCDLLVRHPSRPVRRLLGLSGTLALIRLEEPGFMPAVPLSRPVLDVCKSAVDEVIRAGGADMANMQLLHPATGALHIVAERGFSRPFLDFFETVYDDESACGTALLAGQPVWVPEVESSAIFRGTPALDVMLEAGSQAVASIPVHDTGGRVIAMVSAHYRQPTGWTEEQMAGLAGTARAAGRLLAG